MEENSESTERPDYLPSMFWESSPVLTQIFETTKHRACSPDAVLHAMLARLASCVDPTVTVPLPFVSAKPVCCYAGIYGRPGSGKGEAERIAEELLPFTAEVREGMVTVKLATPEGLIQAYMQREEIKDVVTDEITTRMVQAYSRAYALETEGSILTAMTGQKDSKFNGVLCAMWMAEESGSTLADAERSRLLEKNAYTLGISLSVQPEPAAQLLAMKSVGLPQRLGWAHASPNPETREMVDVSTFTSVSDFENLVRKPEPILVGDQMLASWVAALKNVGMTATLGMVRDLYKLVHQRTKTHELDVHEPLWKSRYALLLALLHGFEEIDDQCWIQSEMMWDTSCAVRHEVELAAERVAAKLRDEDAENKAAVTAMTQEILTGTNPVVVQVAKGMYRYVCKHGTTDMVKVGNGSVNSRQTKIYGQGRSALRDAAYTYGKQQGWFSTIMKDGVKSLKKGDTEPPTK